MLFSLIVTAHEGEGTRGASASTRTSVASTSSANNVLHERRRNEMNSTKKNVFQFRVRWNDLPQAVIEKLVQANSNNEAAHPNDEQTLKLAITKKLSSSYVTFREQNPGSQLSPGRKIYDNVTEQVNLHSKLRYFAAWEFKTLL